MDVRQIEKHGFVRVENFANRIDKWRKPIAAKVDRRSAPMEIRISELTTGMFFSLFLPSGGRVWLDVFTFEELQVLENTFGAYWAPEMESIK